MNDLSGFAEHYGHWGWVVIIVVIIVSLWLGFVDGVIAFLMRRILGAR